MSARPTDADRAGILSHIRYEIEQCFMIPKHHEHDWHLRESVFLAMLVHARVLLPFFESAERHKDDVLCTDFGFPTSPVPIPPNDRERFNKDIAHLTYSRLRHTSETKPWPIQEMLRPLWERSIAFIVHIMSHPPAGAEEGEIRQWHALHRFLTTAKT